MLCNSSANALLEYKWYRICMGCRVRGLVPEYYIWPGARDFRSDVDTAMIYRAMIYRASAWDGVGGIGHDSK